MQLCVARIVPAPPPPALPKAVAKLRPPRPDDPTPRRPPVGFGIVRIGVGVKRPLAKDKLPGAVAVDAKGKGKEVVDEGPPKKKARKDKDAPTPKTLDKKENANRKPPVLSLPKNALKTLGKNSRIGAKPDAPVFKVPPLPPPKAPPVQAKANSANDDPFVDPATEETVAVSQLQTNNRSVSLLFL